MILAERKVHLNSFLKIAFTLDQQEIEILDNADDGFKYEDPRKVQLKVILIGGAVGKTHLEKKLQIYREIYCK